MKDLEENNGSVPKTERKIKLVTEIVSEDEKVYYLYTDGNVYEKDTEGNFKMLDNLNPESQKILAKIMNRFKPGRTDVVTPETKEIENERE